MKLKSTFLSIALLIIGYLQAQTGFNTNPVNWSLPQGGQISSFASYGYNALADGSTGSLLGDQSWTTMDMNGDGRPDVVVTAQVVSIPSYNIDSVFGMPATPYWKVYLNNGNGYNTTPINWSLPQGGQISSFASYGFNAIADGSAGSTLGDQSWTTTDMNGDGRPDLVVTSQVVSIPSYNINSAFGMPSTPYWKVYLNNGTGFDSNPINWSLPQGGQISSFATYGFNAIADGSAGSQVGDQSWTTIDMNGDNKPDLVVTAEVVSIPSYNIDSVFGLPANPYWKVYLNNGTGFNSTPVNWTLPQGGAISSFATYGFNALADGSAGSLVGDQSWSTMDINGDSKPDLIVTSQVVSIPSYNISSTFGLPSNPYWKVYLNNGTGFNTTPINWTLPQGGAISSFANYGFNAIADGSAGSLVGDQSWSTVDMNGDNKPDMVVTSQVVSIPSYNISSTFGLPDAPYWKVYLNGGNGFSTTPINWTLPQGGAISSFANYGFNAVADGSAGSLLGDQSWSIIDIDGDHKLDLAVTSQTVSIPSYNIASVFGMPSTPYWKVYLSNAVLGTAPLDATPKFTVYPNPSKGIFLIEAVSENVNVVVIDLSGRTVLQQNGKSIDLSGYSKGIYLMQVKMDNQTVTQKIILE